MSSSAFVVAPSWNILGWICFQFTPTKFLPSIWHALLVRFHGGVAGNNCWSMTKGRRGGFDENDGRWPKTTKSWSAERWKSCKLILGSNIGIDSSTLGKENKTEGSRWCAKCLSAPFQKSCGVEDSVCRCLWLFTFEQGWHNCHIPVPIRCPPQLRGLRKLGSGEGGLR